MMKTSLPLFPALGLRALCLLFLPLLSTGILAQTEAETIIFTRANIVDGHLEKVLTNATLIVADGKIQQITQEEIDLPVDAKVIDLAGKYLMPGLIDSHVHLRDLEAAQRALYSGVTTARSMGVSHFIDVGFRELAALGKIESPEILAAGYHVRPKPDDGFFIDMPQMSDLMDAGIHGEEAISRMGEVMVEHKVDWIKVNATARAGLPQTDPREPYYSEKELRALVEVGARNGIPVAAHAHGDEGGQAAVRAGVKSIEHGTYLSEVTLKLMAERGTYLVPTIAIVTDLTEPGGDYDVPFLQIRGRHMLPRVRQTAALAHSLGVKIIAATDTGYGPDGTLRLGLELEELVGVGLFPLEAIRAATSLAAEMLGIADHTGRIAIGLDADLLILEGNPLENIGAVHDPLMIVNNGKIVVNRLEW